MKSKKNGTKSDISGLLSLIGLIFASIFQIIKFINQKLQRKNEKPMNNFQPLDNIQPARLTITVTKSTPEQDKEDSLRRDEIIDKIREEIREAVKHHSSAVKVLMSLSRIDGVTSHAERRIVFTFLQHMGEKLNEDRHWPHFNCYHAGEWYNAITPDDMAGFCEQLRSMPQDYRMMVASSAQAIVASGGKPKKSEQSALEKIMSILRDV
jgi:hypothetical protein